VYNKLQTLAYIYTYMYMYMYLCLCQYGYLFPGTLCA